MMLPRHRRFLLILAALAVLGLAAALAVNALRSNLVFYFTPSEVAAGKAPRVGSFRIGALVAQGSLKREGTGQTLLTQFTLTDMAQSVKVRYQGILPDLFAEGKGAVAQGRMDSEGVFIASEVLAKHDENYMPPPARAALDAAARGAAAQGSGAQSLPSPAPAHLAKP